MRGGYGRVKCENEKAADVQEKFPGIIHSFLLCMVLFDFFSSGLKEHKEQSAYKKNIRIIKIWHNVKG